LEGETMGRWKDLGWAVGRSISSVTITIMLSFSCVVRWRSALEKCAGEVRWRSLRDADDSCEFATDVET
jgi:hypothetical protein